jgi:hypothetical protein
VTELGLTPLLGLKANVAETLALPATRSLSAMLNVTDVGAATTAGIGAERPLHASLVVRTNNLNGVLRNGNQQSETPYMPAGLATGLMFTPLQIKRISRCRHITPVQLLKNHAKSKKVNLTIMKWSLDPQAGNRQLPLECQ